MLACTLTLLEVSYLQSIVSIYCTCTYMYIMISFWRNGFVRHDIVTDGRVTTDTHKDKEITVPCQRHGSAGSGWDNLNQRFNYLILAIA